MTSRAELIKLAIKAGLSNREIHRIFTGEISDESINYYRDRMDIDRDLVDHPPHYTNHPSGVECIVITEHMGFNCGNAIKYIWRADEKGDAITDLRKAEWYIKREIMRREKALHDREISRLRNVETQPQD